MKISVVIPVYNAEKYLNRLIASLQRQTFSDFEVIFVDNGSTDKSREIIKQYVNDRILLLEEPCLGVNCARKLGFQHAQGEYIYFVDADDYLREDTLEIFANTSNKTHADYIICDYIYEYDKKSKYKRGFSHLSSEQWITEKSDFIYASTALWNKIIKKECVEETDFFDSNYSEDFVIIMKLLQRVNSIYYITEPLYYYQKNIGSLSNQNLDNIRPFYDLLLSMNAVYDDYQDSLLEEIGEYLILSHLLRHYIKASMLKNEMMRSDLLIHYQDLLSELNYENNEYFKKDKALKIMELVRMNPKLYEILCTEFFQNLLPKGIKIYQRVKKK
ncbi:MAG: glycosyltransferase family 2 protein [Firmicutes bacterium]|nr:glycosyltransferase family 2 protein [Bacillota bacterium]